MKRSTILWMVLLLIFVISGCSKEPRVERRIEGSFQAYDEMSDGTWRCNGYIYKKRLELSGQLPNAAVKSTYVYLSNLEVISFEQAWKASGFSSHLEDYFSVEDAVLVDLVMEP